MIARNENNEPEFLITLFDDVTDRRSLSRELENTKKFLELVVDNIPVSLIVERVSDGRYLLANRSAETILNRRREDATGLTAADIFNPREAKLIIARDEAAIKKRGLLTEEHPISTKDGLRLFLTRRMTVLDEAGEPQYLIKTHEDVTDRRQTESRMAHMAYHDGLTDLPNRAAFLQALAQMIEACAGTDEEFAVLCVDLDGLKEINDVFGHAMGDKLLIEVAGRIQASARGGVVARLSGDEFGLIIDGKQPEAGKALAEKLAQTLSDEFVIDGKSVRTGVTTGISVFPHHGSDAASLLANSGAALFRAKQKSRGSISIFAPEMDQQIRDRRVLHQDLSMAIRNGELSLHYQPQAAAGATVAASKVIGFEALARWMHPVRGFVSPGEFIPLAEESGLIVEMGVWILREACREAASWPVPLQIAVNLSPAQFMHGDVVSLVHSILLETGLAPDRLELEITEGVLIEDFDRGLALVAAAEGARRADLDGRFRLRLFLAELSAGVPVRQDQDRPRLCHESRAQPAIGGDRARRHRPRPRPRNVDRRRRRRDPGAARLPRRTRAATRCRAISSAGPQPIGQYAALVGRSAASDGETARKLQRVILI